jgi:hypothetical protein
VFDYSEHVKSDENMCSITVNMSIANEGCSPPAFFCEIFGQWLEESCQVSQSLPMFC